LEIFFSSSLILLPFSGSLIYFSKIGREEVSPRAPSASAAS